MKGNKKEKNVNPKKGISLIVLVITIIVIVILAVAVILSISNNNPIKNAKQGKVANDEALLKEAANLAYMDFYAEKSLLNTTTEASDYVYEKLEEQGFSIEDIAKVIVDNKNGVNLITIPNGFEYVSVKDSEGKETSTASTGYVIKNSSDGNEFVWIPVTNIADFKTEDGYQDGTLQSYVLSGKAHEPYTASAAEVAEYNAMIASVEKYGGFYIARYEASKKTINGVQVAQSIANQKPWNQIKWGKSMTDVSEGAVKVSRAVYPEENATKEKDAVSTLVYGVQWDQAVRFIEKNYPEILKNSTENGNYKDSEFEYNDLEGNIVKKESGKNFIIPTGSTEYTNTNNIYDMCGNLWEWTMETYSNNKRIDRGGYYYNNGGSNPISNRGWPDPYFTSTGIGFRFSIYMK